MASSAPPYLFENEQSFEDEEYLDDESCIDFPSNDDVAPKSETFTTTTNFQQLSNNMDPIAISEVEDENDTISLLQQVLANQQKILLNQENFEKRLNSLQKDLEEIKSNAPNLSAQHQVMLENSVYIKQMHRSLGKITGEVIDEKLAKIAAKFPVHSLTELADIEEHLKCTEYAAAVKTFLHSVKGTAQSPHSTLRRVFTDGVLINFNWSGKCNKRALADLTIMTVLYDVFNVLGKAQFEAEIRKAVDLSHNRFHQNKYSEKKFGEKISE